MSDGHTYVAFGKYFYFQLQAGLRWLMKRKSMTFYWAFKMMLSYLHAKCLVDVEDCDENMCQFIVNITDFLYFKIGSLSIEQQREDGGENKYLLIMNKLENYRIIYYVNVS